MANFPLKEAEVPSPQLLHRGFQMIQVGRSLPVFITFVIRAS
jgi:hypothetical protein